MNVNLDISANHKSNYTASFYTRKPEWLTASTKARNTLYKKTRITGKTMTILRVIYIRSLF